MKPTKFVVITSIVAVTIMLVTTIGSGALNVLSIQIASAQDTSGSNSSQGANMMSMDPRPFTGLLYHAATGANFTSSVSIFQPIINAYKASIHVSLSDAITTAEKSIGKNSTTVAAFIHPEREYIVYNIFAIDSNSIAHRVLVDPGNGKVLLSQQMSLIEMMRMLHGGMMGPGAGMMGPGAGMMGPGAGMMGPGAGMMSHGMMGPGAGMMGPGAGISK